MKCSAYEQSIYLWEEISPEEKDAVNKHMEICPDCAALFQQVQVMQQQVTKVSAKRTISPNAAQLTSRIMQGVHEKQQRSHTTRLTSVLSPFQLVRYACATLSLVLLISFGLEYVQTGAIQKTQTTALEEGIILSSAIIRSSAADRKKRKSIFSACKTPFTNQLAYKECIKQQFQ